MRELNCDMFQPCTGQISEKYVVKLVGIKVPSFQFEYLRFYETKTAKINS